VLVHYTGWLADGTQFDSSVGKQPFSVTIGQGSVIQGWDEGLAGMKVGGRRILVIPPELGYGAAGSPPTIPADAMLVFEIVMLSIQ
jgi:FKBP-type peptidyl-prolyl cis-trans isomerase